MSKKSHTQKNTATSANNRTSAVDSVKKGNWILQDNVSIRDRRWFEAHPGVKTYARLGVPGEFTLIGRPEDGSECEVDGFLVLVYQVRSDFRLRMPLPGETKESTLKAIKAIGLPMWVVMPRVSNEPIGVEHFELDPFNEHMLSKTHCCETGEVPTDEAFRNRVAFDPLAKAKH